VDFEFTLSLNEAEFNALAGLCAYNPEDIMKVLKSYISENYASEHGCGLESLIKSTAAASCSIRGRVNSAKEAFGKLGQP